MADSKNPIEEHQMVLKATQHLDKDPGLAKKTVFFCKLKKTERIWKKRKVFYRKAESETRARWAATEGESELANYLSNKHSDCFTFYFSFFSMDDRRLNGTGDTMEQEKTP